jgi:hypothetical protein
MNKHNNFRKHHNKNLNKKFNDSNTHDNDNEYLEDDFTKQQILEYLYNTIELSNYKYKLIEYEYDLPLLKEKPYFVSPNYNGIHSLLIFIKIKEKFLSFIIDRRTLTYNLKQIDYGKVKMIPIFYRFNKDIYDGTIFDGVYLYNHIGGTKHFVVNDIYYFRGKNMLGDKMINKILNVSTYLETANQDNNMNNLIFIVNKLHPLNEIQQLINVYIPKSKYNKSIKGIAFYSEFSGAKLIYLYNNISNEEQKIEKPNEIRLSHIEPGTTKTFKMKKTNIVDVYNLFLGQKLIEDNKKLFKYKNIGIAYVPTKECSFFCKDAFMNCEELLMDCKLDVEKNRWIPVKLSENKKRPDLLD